jgi:hypothetical protein
VPVARYLAAVSSRTVIATKTQSLPIAEIREWSWAMPAAPCTMATE